MQRTHAMYIAENAENERLQIQLDVFRQENERIHLVAADANLQRRLREALDALKISKQREDRLIKQCM